MIFFFFNFTSVYGINKSSSKVCLFLNDFLCVAAFFSCEQSVVKCELPKTLELSFFPFIC